MKSFKDYIAEEHPTWHVTFKTGHKPQKVKGRNTAEAIKKAEKLAQKSGEKDPRQLAMYKGIKKVSEEVEQIDERSSKIDRSVQDFHVNVPGHGMVLIKARSEEEAHSKARAKFEKGDDKSDTFKESVELSESDIAEILRQYALSENVNADQLADLTEEEINEIIGKAIGKTFKYGAKAIVGGARLAKKGAKAVSSQGRIDREKKRLEREKERFKRAKESRSRFTAQGRKNRADDRAAADKIRKDREKLAQKRKAGDFS